MIEISKIERSNRKTLSVTVTKEGQIVVKAPIKLPEAEIYRFLNEKRSWIEKKLQKVESIQDEFKDIIEYRQLLLFGIKYFGYFSSRVSKITVDGNKMLIPNKIPQAKLHKKVLSWYKKQADEYLIKRTLEISNTIKIFPTEVKCTGSRGRWGACNNSRQVFLNWRCIMLPPSIIDYVIVHELAHIIELNHSQKFWSVVERILPEYKKCRQIIKTYGFLLKLF